MSYILEAKDLNTFYGRSHILFDVCVTVGSGETVCLMGRNGAGKTTTMRSIMGLTPSCSGQVLFKGTDISRLPAYKRARLGLGYVPEDRRILSPFTVRENLGLGCIPSRTGRWNLDTVLKQFPLLAHLLDRLGGSLSGGEQQMLTIARALMGNPDLLLLDEPTEGLAPVVVSVLKELLMNLKASRTTILLSEQNIRFAMGVSDRVVVIDKGHIVFSGSIDQFKEESAIHKKYLAV